MKTLTEFAAPTLKNASRVRQELVTAGKTPEELPAALGEALKLEGDKLTLMLYALDVVGEKVSDLKRVLVGSLGEGEKAPGGAQEKDGKQFVVEYYPPIQAKGARTGAPGGRDDRDRGGKGDRKKGRRGGGRGRDGERGSGGPGRNGPPGAGRDAASAGGGGRPRRDAQGRGNPPGRGSERPSAGPPPIIKPKSTAAAAAPVAAEVPQASTPQEPSSQS